MGEVFKAVGPDGEEVALKVARPELARDEMFRRRFAREARAARSIDHRHVVPVLDEGEHEGAPYLVQAFVAGGSLAERIGPQGLALEEVVRMCVDIARGLDAIHQAGLVHRDVKPANVLIDLEGRALVADLGLVKLREASILTRPGATVGSWHYMAPEQIRGEEVGPAADLYSLGCLAHECLCGQPPFADRQGMRVMWAHLQEAPEDPGRDRDDIPADVTWVIGLALDKVASNRPGSALAFARMLQSAAGMLEGTS